MLRFFALRLALPAVLAATLIPAAVRAQSENSQSVAEAARRAREQKKAAAKPAKVVTEDDMKPASSDATAGSATSAQPGTAAQPSSTGAQGPRNPAEAEKAAKDRAALKEQIKQTESDLDLLQRELRLDQDSFYSNPNSASDTAGKAKLDALKQQISDKQQDLDRLKAQLAALPEPQESPTSTPPKS
jgi:hypothetical protein